MDASPSTWVDRLLRRRSSGAGQVARDQQSLDGVFAAWGAIAPRVVATSRSSPACLPGLALPGGGGIAMPRTTTGDGLRFFQLLHEAAHCMVHARHAPFPRGVVDDPTTAWLNDWVLAPLHQSMARDAFTERWADAWAALVVRSMDATPAAGTLIGEVASARASALARAQPHGFVHDTVQVLRTVMCAPVPSLADAEALCRQASLLAAQSWWAGIASTPLARAAFSEAMDSLSPEPWLREHTLAGRQGTALATRRLDALLGSHPLGGVLRAIVLPPVPRCDVTACSFEVLVAHGRPLPVARRQMLASRAWQEARKPGLPAQARSRLAV